LRHEKEPVQKKKIYGDATVLATVEPNEVFYLCEERTYAIAKLQFSAPVKTHISFQIRKSLSVVKADTIAASA